MIDPEEKIAHTVVNRLSSGDCCCVATMRGIGQRYVYNLVLTKLKGLKINNQDIRHAVIKDRAEFEALVEKIEKDPTPSIYLIRIFFDGDYYDLIQRLNNIRIERFTDFSICIIAGPENIYSAYKAKLEIVTTFLYILKPWNKKESEVILSIYEQENNFILPPPVKSKIIEISGGHGGFLKVLFYAYYDHNNLDFSMESVLQIEGIKTWIYYILKSIPFDLSSFFSTNATEEQREFSEKFGFTSEGKIFSPIISNHLQKTGINKTAPGVVDIEILLARQEKAVFNLLLSKKDQIVSREEISFIMWGEKPTERHSDWALDHVVYRIRTKLRQQHFQYRIITKKGEGFILKILENTS